MNLESDFEEMSTRAKEFGWSGEEKTPEHGWERHKAAGFKETLLQMTKRVIQEMSEGSWVIFHEGLKMGFVGLFLSMTEGLS